MAEIYPFRALRYNPGRVRLEEVVTQPYDKITPEMQERYYAASPYNLVRVELGKSCAGDGADNNVYTRAAACFRQWRQEGILVADPEPSIYFYRQDFRLPGQQGSPRRREGLIALGKLHDYAEGVVFRHEQTLSGPKEDRLQLLRATGAHFGLLFMLYSDPEQQVEPLLAEAVEHRAPDMDLADEYAVRHRVWKLCAAGLIASVQRAMADKKLIIADGHHRYETALAWSRECGGALAGGTGAACDSRRRAMMTFVNLDAPGLAILPTHRLVVGLPSFDAAKVLAAAQAYFAVRRLEPGDALPALSQAPPEQVAWLAITAAQDYLLTERSGAAGDLLRDLSPPQRRLDVVQLHRILLEKALGLSAEAVRSQQHLRYLRDPAEAMACVRQGRAHVAFILRPVRIQQVREIALAGEVLPQKSTDFYPKLLSGLTIYAPA